MKRIDLGVFEPVEEPSDAGFVGEGGFNADEVQDLVCLAAFLVPELYQHGGPERAATTLTQWAEGDAALLGAAETAARRDHHREPAEILGRARGLVTA